MGKKIDSSLARAYDVIEKKLQEFRERSQVRFDDLSDDDLFSVMATRYVVEGEADDDNQAILECKSALVDGPNDRGIDTLLVDSDGEGNYCLYVGQGKHYSMDRKASMDDVRNAVGKAADAARDVLLMLRGRKNIEGNRRLCEVLRRLRAKEDVEYEAVALELDVYFSCRGPADSATRRYASEKADAVAILLKEDGMVDPSVRVNVYYADDLGERIRLVDIREQQFVPNGNVEGCRAICEVKETVDGDPVGYSWAASAKSLVRLYREHEYALLAQNLRFHVKGSLDGAIQRTIKETPGDFWAKNNGITIVAEEADLDGNVMHLKNFSIVNGGQTIWNIQKVDPANDFYVPVKIVLVKDAEQARKDKFIMEVAQASNSQKVIKDVDLISVQPEQQNLRAAFHQLGVEYLLKRGMATIQRGREREKIELAATKTYALSGILLLPGYGRSNPAKLLAHNGDNDLYSSVFSKEQSASFKLAQRIRDLALFDRLFKNCRARFRKEIGEGSGNEFDISLFRIWENGRSYAFSMIGLASYVAHGMQDRMSLIINANGKPTPSEYESAMESLAKSGLEQFGTIFNEDSLRDRDHFEEEIYNYINASMQLLATSFYQSHLSDVSNFLKPNETFRSVVANWYPIPLNGFRSLIERHINLFSRQ